MARRTLWIAVAVLALIALAAVIAILLMRAPTPAVVSVPSPTPTSTPVPTPTLTFTPSAPTSVPTATPQAAAAITGRFAYPSDFIPAVTVYAISTTDARVWYSEPFAGFGNPPRPTLPPGTTQPTYTISGVAPGTYWVVAYRNDGNPGTGYYSRQVECFRNTPSGPCPDVSLATATVNAGQTTSGIDVITWGPPPPNQPSLSLPPRPTSRPQGYILPSECQLVDSGTVQGSATTWKISCPQGLPSNYLRPSLEAQGWVSCGTKVWQKGGLQIAITDAVNVTGFTGWLDQRSVGASGCTQPTPPPP